MRISVLPLSLAVLGALSLGACGGSGGGSGGGGTSTTPPAAPAPTPGPTATPTPTPAVTFSVVAIGTMPSTVFFDSNGSGIAGDSGDGVSATTVGGEFGRNADVPASHVSGTLPATATVAFLASGRDSATGLPFGGMAAPAGATVISPLSSVIAAQGSEATVRTALGLDSGADAIRAGVSVLAFNPTQNLASGDTLVAHDAARLTSVNVQLLAMALLLKDTNGDPVDRGAPLQMSSGYLAALIREGVGARLNDPAVILAALRRSAWRTSGDSNLTRMADYVAAYIRAMPSLLRTPAEARAWMHAFQFGVLADIQTPNFLSRGTIPDENAIRAVAAAFADAPAPVLSAFFATTDYIQLVDHPIAAMDYRVTLADCLLVPSLPTCNDSMDYSGMTITGGLPAARVTAVSARDPAVLSVVLNADGAIAVSRVGSYLGLTWFTYTAQTPAGLTATGRVYVRVRQL